MLPLRGEAGAVVAATRELIGSGSSVVLAPDHRLTTWSPQTPVSYTLTAAVGEDEVNVTAAVRTFEFRGPDARLNGHRIELQGDLAPPELCGDGRHDQPAARAVPGENDQGTWGQLLGQLAQRVRGHRLRDADHAWSLLHQSPDARVAVHVNVSAA